MKQFLFIAVIVMTCGFLAACDTALNRNYVAKNTYDATDKLVSEAGRAVSRRTPLLVTTITDIDYMETSNTFGRTISEQIASRLVQNGYNVVETKLRDSLNVKRGIESPVEAGEYLTSRNVDVLKGEQQATAAVTGTYAIAGQQVIVTLKMLNTTNGKIISATDFSLPLDANTRRLINTGGIGGSSFYGTSMFYE